MILRLNRLVFVLFVLLNRGVGEGVQFYTCEF